MHASDCMFRITKLLESARTVTEPLINESIEVINHDAILTEVARK